MRHILLVLTCSLIPQGHLLAQSTVPEEVKQLEIEQRPGNFVPGDAKFRDASGETVLFRDVLGDRPTILVLAYYRCPRLCSVLINNLVDALNQLSFNAGEEYQVIIVSIDPTETPELAAANKERIMDRYRRGRSSSASWHLLTGHKKEIDRLTDAVGFQYVYDTHRQVYRHAAGITLLTPKGKVSRYIFGIDFAPQDLRMGLLEASEGKVSSPVDRVLLLTCFGYNPDSGKYTLAVTKLMRTAGILTVLLLGTYILWNLRRDRKRHQPGEAKAPNDADRTPQPALDTQGQSDQ